MMFGHIDQRYAGKKRLLYGEVRSMEVAASRPSNGKGTGAPEKIHAIMRDKYLEILK